jgi:hypothetical protein
MLRRFKHLCWAACLVAAVQSASAFSFVGIAEPYQIFALGYLGSPAYQPHNLGEEFRWNVPTNYYAFDETFVDYFGTHGTAAADAAFKVLNDTLSTNVSSWSLGLDEFPLESRQLNYTASALHLFDLKSFTLQTMLQELALTDSIAYTWTLRIRVLPTGASCPNYVYGVIQRNFDPVTFDPSAYVNGILYTYYIVEQCPAIDDAYTVPVSVDPEAPTRAPVARHHNLYSGLTSALIDYFGYYYTGLTRDDVGGLRYLLSTNNLILENAGAGTLTSITNPTSQLLYSSNLTTLAQLALTNSDAQLAALYPGLVFSAPATNFPVVVTNITTTAYYTNPPYGAYSNTPPQLVFSTNYSLAVQLEYLHYFGNLQAVEFKHGAWTNFPITDLNSFVGPQIATLQTISINPSNTPDAPYGVAALSTNVTEKNFITNQVVGEFFILTSNFCNMLIVANELTQTNSETNLLFGATNAIAYTNATQTTNTAGATNIIEAYTNNLITYSTNHVFLAFPVTCQGTNISLREGINTMHFVRRDYDSLLNRFWEPITNTFTAVAVTNYATYDETIQRVVTAPDIVLSAADIATGPAVWPIFNIDMFYTSLSFNTNGILPGDYGPGSVALAGPGATTINLTYNKVGSTLFNFGPVTVDQATANLSFVWGSFDGTTNLPVVYPVGSSLTNIVDQIVLQTFPTALPASSVGIPYAFAYVNPATGVTYTNTFSGAGGQPPYSFSLATGSVLPPGLVLANGVLSGTPSASGTYPFVIQMTDTGQRFTDTAYSLTINP